MTLDRPVRLAYIIDTIATPGAGTERQLLILLRGLDRAVVEPHLVCLHESDWMRSQSFDFPVSYCGLNRVASLQPIGAVRRFKKIHQQHRFDLVQTFFRDGNIFGTIAARLAGIRLIVSSRRNTGYWHNKAQIATLRFLRRWTTVYLANSNAAAQTTVEIEGAPPDRVAVIYNALDLDRFAVSDPSVRTAKRRAWAVPDNAVVIGAVANLRPVKNLAALLDAFSQIAQRFPSAHLVFVGEGDQRGPLEDLARRYGLAERVHLPGADDDIPSCLAGIDIAVLPSFGESFSNSLIEYMAASRPTIASNVGGNPEAVEHEQTGLLFESDNRHELAACLMRLIEDRPFADRLARAARESAMARFSKASILRRHEQFYTDLVRRGRYEKTA